MNIKGVIGGTTSFIGSSAPLSGIGTYSAPSTQPLYMMDLSGGLVGSPSSSTIRLWFGGARNATTAEGKIMGLYANWNSTNSNYDVGFLSSGAVTANPYPDIGMWQITSGALTLESKGTLSSPTLSVPATLRSGVIAAPAASAASPRVMTCISPRPTAPGASGGQRRAVLIQAFPHRDGPLWPAPP